MRIDIPPWQSDPQTAHAEKLMNRMARTASTAGAGVYGFVEAARLLRMPARSVQRWMSGYSYRVRGEQRRSAPLWTPGHILDDGVELDFADLIELRFVRAFVSSGIDLSVVRACHDYAKECLGTRRPFMSGRFQTDGATIFLDAPLPGPDGALLDLRKRQYAIRDIVRREFRDLDLYEDVVVRWRPHQGKPSIVIDPERSFGRPIAADYGIPVSALAAAVEAEGDTNVVALQFRVPVGVVKDAAIFQSELDAA